MLTVAPAYMVGSFFLKHDPGPEEPKSAVTSAVWFGVIAIVLALIISFIFELVLAGDFLVRVSGGESETSLPLFLDVLIFATIEEFVKFIPIALYLLKKDFFNEITDGIIYFSIVGLTFGAIESFLYGVTAGGFGFAVALMRLALGLFFHGALTAVVGYHFAKAKVTNQGMSMALIALAAVSVTHAAYNFFVFSIQVEPLYIFGAAAMALSANAAMFWLYFVAMKRDIELGIAGPQYIEQRRLKNLQQRTNAAISQTRYAATVQSVPQPPLQPMPPAPQQQPTYTNPSSHQQDPPQPPQNPPHQV